MNQTYQFTSERFDGSLIFTFDQDDNLCKFEVEGNLCDDQIRYLRRFFPMTKEDLMSLHKRNRTTKVRRVVLDYTFKELWDEYANKVGNKKRAERIWETLTPAERSSAVSYLTTYDNHLIKNPGINKAYPETYLHQRRWDN